MAQIDREEGNQSVLREVRAYAIIPTPLRKENKVLSSNRVRVQRGKGREARHKGVLRQKDSPKCSPSLF